ncbi:hypothetical protein EG329_009497 [Mollisiaceae sp. DMI_Dod_QoI]|nr:hypothetical protein EG329_009497 [Helotiales sp. DMI_Dod_QoI]
MSSANLKLNILVIGAGISGSNAAICLASHGYSVTLLDYRTNLSGTFASSIHLYPNSARVVDQYGLWPILESVSAPKCHMRLHRGDTGEVIRARDIEDYVELYGYPRILREEYVPVMMEVVKKHGVNLRLGCRVQETDQEATAVILDTGERIEADLIVGADAIPGGGVELESSTNAYICRIPQEPLLQDPELAFIMNEHALWMSSNRVIVSSPFKDCLDLTLLYVAETDISAGDWSIEGDVQEMRARFSDYDIRWQNVLDKGAGMGIEDGAALAECLDRAESVSDIPRLLRAFETIRKPRTTRVKHVARTNAEVFMLSDPEAQRKRDDERKSDPSNKAGNNFDKGKVEKLKQGSLAKSNWLLGYDVYESVSVGSLSVKVMIGLANNGVRRQIKSWIKYYEFRKHKRRRYGSANAGYEGMRES